MPRPSTRLAAPSERARTLAAERLAGLATPAGALGSLGDAAVWLSAVQDACPPRPLDTVRVVVFAGDHGVTAHGVSAYPKEITALMVRQFLSGGAGVAVLARQHGATLRVLDLGVDVEPGAFPAEVGAHKVRRSSGAIHVEDALTPAETAQALAVGAAVAAEEIAAGADLLIPGDMGIGNTTPSAALIAASLGLDSRDVTGRGSGVDEVTLAHKEQVVAQALARAGERVADPVDRLTALGSADLAAQVGFLAEAARSGVPVLLDGVISVACALVAEDYAPGSSAWFAAGHRSPEPAQALALSKLGLEPLLDLGMRLGEGSGAVAALPVLRSAGALLTEMSLLADVLGS
ncbi:nicotinate-nucleotide--dimethylbenzimidazole phosphoribosyltransferase [Mumia zhuanghuii]|uniref:Nicotinate-nucleotide--dimethylbenzimidazole phosphoribosyltransferase n=1 Tax=Mumia zhuanghuii TaxID=2585211 RepID=A0A5C4MPB6_9ACTN|nr:nicotinate-nucleotide--dimethylbenzimidazole phosphoribosyltransferase [Mumia zhuanghuii]TNC46455.1 nicotinate-nucleotide--dimethylbenzimidazole phosphoribosyltransferase [Mumia zhuanghuii]TNC47161.1 nicotinate-nucleotide--dimethylbenzimidazole phosphoribosyltransferase [Mumia zhuanghuii]